MSNYTFLSTSGSLSHTGRTFELPDKVPLTSPRFIEAISLMPESVAREHTCLALYEEGETLHVAYWQRDDIPTQDKLRFLLNYNIVFHHRSRRQIQKAIDHFYGKVEDESCDSILEEFTDTSIDFTETEPCYAKTSARSLALNDDEEVDEFTGRIRRKLFSTKPRTRGQGAMSQYALRSSYSDEGNGMFFYTIREGQKALAYRNGGKIDVIEGPAKIWKGWTSFRPMQHHVAHPGEFLVVRFLDGRQENLKGPTEIWFDPRIHEEITVQEGLSLAAKEAVVVYGENEEGDTKRRIVYGPGLFVPRPGEWLHNFSWHASRGGSKGVEKKPNGLKFQKLWLMPDQMYHDVRDVRTADDAVLVIRLMIFFELLDIEKMLDTTHDPIGDFINAATSDVVEFTGKRSFEVFKQQTEQLNDLATYSQLIHRAEQCGYRINNVVYRGYGAPESLQKMHEEAIAARTSLQLNSETEKQTQELEDYRLQCQVERSERRRSEQTTEVEHDIELQQKRESAKLEVQRQEDEFRRQQKRLDAELQSKIHRQSDEQKRSHLEELRSMGVDLTEFLTQGRADQVIELRGRGGNQPHLHLTQNGSKKPK